VSRAELKRELQEELKTGWLKITLVRELKDRFASVSEHISVNEFDVLCFIAHQTGNVTITGILGHPYFKDISISTVNRTVKMLTLKGLIIASDNSCDRRERLLMVK